jgi:AcrR family transcriptional regulator
MSKTAGMTDITAGDKTMGWHDFYRRRDELDAVVELGELRVSDVFPSKGELLAALHQRWARRLGARLELAELSADDQVDAVGEAWRTTVSENARLRALLDEYANDPALRPLVDAEHRMLARAAGLTEAGDAADEEASIGAAFVALQKAAPERRRNPVERLLRRLVPSA